MNYSPEQLLEFWKKGKSLNAALWEFCDQKYKNEFPKAYIANTENKKPSWAEFFNEAGKSGQYLLQMQNALNNLKKNLCEKLNNEDLIAVGYLESSNSPSPIPLYLCISDNIDLNKSSIAGNGFKYSGVKIYSLLNPAKKIPQKRQILPPDIPVGENKVGRQTLKTKIIAAYEFLKEHGRIDFTAPLKEHTKLIQKTVQDMYGITDIKGMKHEAIRRAVGERFKHDRASSKKALK